jgi:hypothetical protein
VLLNPMQGVPVLPGTRMLTESFGLVGVLFEDPRHAGRNWTITNLFAPIGRALGGIRAKLVDDKGFVSFVNQRDLELLLDIAQPGQWCPWTESRYPGINAFDEGWFGICCDDDDLLDDLCERELLLRQQYSGLIPDGAELIRRIHLDDDNDHEELLLLLWDRDPDTNYAPDTRMETLRRRWVQVERRRLIWSRVSDMQQWQVGCHQ